MPTVEFTQSNQHIHDTILRQAGELKKGFIELIQNSSDSMIKRPKKEPIKITVINDDTVIVSDTGKGFDRIEDFSIFGRDDEKNIGKGVHELGEFHVGRGQIFAMARENDEGIRDIIYYTNLRRKKIKIDKIKITKKNVTFRWQFKEHEYEGTTVIIKNDKFDYFEIKEYLENTVLFFPRTITLNGEALTVNPTKEITSTKWVLDLPHAKIFYTNTSGGFELYNLGLRVRRYIIANGFSGFIFTKCNLKLDQARTSVMDSDERWATIQSMTRANAINRVMDFKKPTNSQKEMMLRMSGRNSDILDRCKDKKIIPLSNGKFITPRELEAMDEVYISKESHDRTESKAIDSGYVVLENNGYVKEYLERKDIKSKKFNECPIRKSKYFEIKEEDYTLIQKEILKELSENFSDDRKLYWGKSKGTMAWTDGKKEVFFNPDKFNLQQWTNGKSEILLWKLVETLAHELSHDNDTLLTDEHGEEFDKENVRNLEYMGLMYSKWVVKRIKQKIKEESGEKFTTRIIKNRDNEGNLIVKVQIPKEMENKHKLLRKKEVELSLLGSMKY